MLKTCFDQFSDSLLQRHVLTAVTPKYIKAKISMTNLSCLVVGNILSHCLSRMCFSSFVASGVPLCRSLSFVSSRSGIKPNNALSLQLIRIA